MVEDPHQDREAVFASDCAVVLIGGASLDTPGTGSDPWSDNTLLEVFEVGSGDWAEAQLWIKTGSQWGPYSVTTNQHSERPREADDSWEDVVEVSVRCDSGLIVTDLVDNDPMITLADGPGDFRLRVCARARSRRHDDASDLVDASDQDAPTTVVERDWDTPVEWYLAEVWPEPLASPRVVRLTSDYARTVLAGPVEPAAPPGQDAALAAAARIGRDADGEPGARALSGRTAGARISLRLPGPRRSHFRTYAHGASRVANPGGGSWSVSGAALDDEFALDNPDLWSSGTGHPDQLTGHRCALRSVFVEVDSPHRAVRSWNWLRQRAQHTWPVQWDPVLPQDVRVSATLEQDRDESGEPWTTVVIELEVVPEEWLDDLTAWWQLQLDIDGQRAATT